MQTSIGSSTNIVNMQIPWQIANKPLQQPNKAGHPLLANYKEYVAVVKKNRSVRMSVYDRHDCSPLFEFSKVLPRTMKSTPASNPKCLASLYESAISGFAVLLNLIWMYVTMSLQVIIFWWPLTLTFHLDRKLLMTGKLLDFDAILCGNVSYLVI